MQKKKKVEKRYQQKVIIKKIKIKVEKVLKKIKKKKKSKMNYYQMKNLY